MAKKNESHVAAKAIREKCKIRTSPCSIEYYNDNRIGPTVIVTTGDDVDVFLRAEPEQCKTIIAKLKQGGKQV